jgi:hypothetical protein
MSCRRTRAFKGGSSEVKGDVELIEIGHVKFTSLGLEEKMRELGRVSMRTGWYCPDSSGSDDYGHEKCTARSFDH